MYWTVYILLCMIHFYVYMSQEIFVNINMDYLPLISFQKIYDGNIGSINCNLTKFNSTTDGLYMMIDSSLSKSGICENDAKTISINIFIFYTNIRSALIIVKNENLLIEEIMKNSSGKILTFSNDYVIFVQCSNNDVKNCKPKIFDQKATFANSNLKFYSSCNKSFTKLSISEVIYKKNFFIAKSSKTSFVSSLELNCSNMEYVSTDCINGGTKRVNTDKDNKDRICDCLKIDAFIEHGPQCEALQQSIKTTQYLYVLPNTNFLTIEFSLFSPAHSKETEIFKINFAGGNFLQYIIKENEHELTVLNNKSSIKYALDEEAIWLDILIEISSSSTKFKINDKESLITYQTTEQFKLDTWPLIILANGQIISNKICLGNLKINSRIVDLYTPNHSDCVTERCKKCESHQKCIFIPFKSSSDINVYCICKRRTEENDFCFQNQTLRSQLRNNKHTKWNIKTNELIENAIFTFRTLSDEGNLITFILASPENLEISIKISNKKLYWSKKHVNITITNDFHNYEVSDGQWHNLEIKIKKYLFEIKLDENIAESNWFDNFFSDSKIKEILVGPLTNSKSNKTDLSTCFDDMTIIPNNRIATNIHTVGLLKHETEEGCDEGINCASLNCKKHETCDKRWQQSSCVCKENFVNVDGDCILKDCNCYNNGKCIYNDERQTKQCICSNDFNGESCENKVSQDFPWWIILVVCIIILILIIAFIVYKCCKSRKEISNSPDINKIHENTVCYNDQAGESDFVGPPINIDLIMKVINIKETITTMDLLEKKNTIDNNNKDLVLDQTLDYRYEGLNSDIISLSSLGSGSTNEQLNIEPLDNENSKFSYLKNIYK